MNWNNPRSVEKKILRLTRAINEIDEYFYMPTRESDRVAHACMLERKRDDMVRVCVLQLHTAIEDVLNSLIICRVLDTNPEERLRKIRGIPGHALHQLLFGAGSLGFDNKLNLAVSLRLISATIRDRLKEFNTLRNKCSHNWILKATIRRGKRPAQKK